VAGIGRQALGIGQQATGIFLTPDALQNN